MSRKPKKIRSLKNLDAQRPKAASSEAMNWRDGQTIGVKHWVFAAALALAVLFVYQPAWHGGFLFDDDLHLLNNPVLQPGGLLRIWVPGTYVNYWPVTSTAFRLQFELWGLDPLGFHLINIALHAISAILIWRILVLLRVPGAMFASALFALHPVNVQSVAWITQLKNTLSLPLALLSVLFYFLYEQRGGRWRFAAAVGAFLLAALAKGMTLTLPIVLLACAWWQRGRIERRDLLRVLPYVLIGVFMIGMEVCQQHVSAGGNVVRCDNFLSRTAVAGCAVWFYLWKLIWPADLMFVYPQWRLDAWSVLSYLPGALLAVILALAWRRRRSWGRPATMLIVCYVALLLPVLGFVNIYFMKYSLVADHWQYAAMIVPCAVFAGAAATWGRRHGNHPAGFALCFVLLAVLATLTWRQSRMYADAATLYRTTIDRNPNCWLAHNNLGNTLLSNGRIDEAIAQYRKTLEIEPDSAEAHVNLGVALAGRGQVDEASAEYKKALELRSDLVDAHYNLGTILAGRGQIDEAIIHYKKALELKPDDAKAHYNLGNALAGRGKFDEAIIHYQKALEIKPDYVNAHFNLGNALTGRGRIDEAIAQYQTALELKPDYANAHFNLGNALAVCGRIDEAIAQYQTALAIKPDYVDARRNLEIALSEWKKIRTALAQQRELLRSRPKDLTLLNDAAWLLATAPYASVRNGPEAIELAQQAIKLSDGKNPVILDTLAAAYAEAGRFAEAVQTARRALDLATQQNKQALSEAIQAKIRLYEAGKPFHGSQASPAKTSTGP